MKKFNFFAALFATLLICGNLSAQNVAKIGTTEYATLQLAFDNATDGQTIVLLSNIQIGSTVTINKPSTSIILDMAGKEWNFNDGASSLALGIDLQAGKLTVKGNGGFQDTVATSTSNFIQVANGAELVINNGNLTTYGTGASIVSNGTLTVKNAWANVINVNGGKATLNGTTINSQITLANSAELEVLDGTIKNIDNPSANAKVTIKGGKIAKIKAAGTNLFQGGKIDTVKLGNNTIEAGKFNYIYKASASYTFKGGVYTSEKFADGGDIANIETGYSLKPNGDPTYIYQVSKDLIKIVETGVIYGSMQEAFDAVADGQTIQLQHNIELNGNMNLYLTGTITLDLNGKTWKLNNDQESQTLGMRVYTGNLIVKGNGSIIYDNTYGACNIFDMYAGTNLTIENGTFNTTGTAIKSDGTLTIKDGTMGSITMGDNATALTIEAGTISQQISLPSSPAATLQVTINGGTIENITTMNDDIRGTHVTINGGTITWLQNSDSTIINDGTITNINGGFNVINGGNFTNLYFENNPDEAPYYKKVTYTINAGIFVSKSYITDEGTRNIIEDVPADKDTINNEAPATKTNYPYTIGHNPYYFKRNVATGNWATMCYDSLITRVTDAAIYEFKARNSAKTQVIVDPVEPKDMVLGKAYLFYAKNNKQLFAYDKKQSTTTVTNNNGLYGTFQDITTTEDAWVVKGPSIIPAKAGSSVPAYRAYVDVEDITEDDNEFNNPAPKRGRLVFPIANTPTGNQVVIPTTEQTQKMMVNGQIVILRDGKMFNAIGQEL